MSSTSWERIFPTIRNLFHTFMFYIFKSAYLYRSRWFFLINIFFTRVVNTFQCQCFSYFEFQYFFRNQWFSSVHTVQVSILFRYQQFLSSNMFQVSKIYFLSVKDILFKCQWSTFQLSEVSILFKCQKLTFRIKLFIASWFFLTGSIRATNTIQFSKKIKNYVNMAWVRELDPHFTPLKGSLVREFRESLLTEKGWLQGLISQHPKFKFEKFLKSNSSFSFWICAVLVSFLGNLITYHNDK